jgi:hypothetical protein
MKTEDDIKAKIDQHGARKIYEAACARLAGDRTQLEALGIFTDLAEANQLMAAAFARLTAAERAQDYWATMDTLGKLDETRTTKTLQVGSIVIAKRATAICDVGERGVCYEEYTLGDRPGWSFIFESGRYDGFSPEEVNWMLEVTGEVCVEVTDYEFKSVIRLSEDFRRGRFAAAFS